MPHFYQEQRAFHPPHSRKNVHGSRFQRVMPTNASFTFAPSKPTNAFERTGNGVLLEVVPFSPQSASQPLVGNFLENLTPATEQLVAHDSDFGLIM